MNKILMMAAGLLAGSFLQGHGQSLKDFSTYRDPGAVKVYAETLQKAHPSRVKLHNLATSPGGRPVTLIEIGSDLKQVPAVWAGANFEGITPLATEGALFLASMLLDSTRYSTQVKWYILPQPNPDAAEAFFAPMKWERKVNNLEVNDDVDDGVNEDGPEDLSGDGVITLMRVEHPEGTHIVAAKEPRLMVRADATKGERGKFKIYPEGVDNDNDGAYNEDGPGGVNAGISFPHLFSREVNGAGLWPGETPEVYGIMEFIFAHPEIAMAFTLGSSDFCLAPPPGGRTGGANLQSITVPARYATRFGLDPEKTYTMEEIMEVLKTAMPGSAREVTPDVVAGMLGLGAAVNPLPDDLKFYTSFAEQYKDYLKSRGAVSERMAPPAEKNGSFELWAYYHLGLPSFAMNLFTPPKPVAEKPSGDAPTPATPKQLGEMAKNLPKTPAEGEPEEKEKALLAWSDAHPEANGFVAWTPFTHPKLGKVEIGGFAPYFPGTPPPSMIDSLCRLQIPWLLQLSSKLPKPGFLKEEVTPLGAGIYKLEIYIENNGILPYPIAMGARNRQPAPVVILLEGDKTELLEGFARTPLETIGGNQVKKLTWIIRTEGKTTLKATLDSAVFGNSVKQITIGG